MPCFLSVANQWSRTFQPLGVEPALAVAGVPLEQSDHTFHRVLADHIDAVLGIQPSLLVAKFLGRGHRGADPPKLDLPASFGENQVGPTALNEAELPGRRRHQPAHVDNRLLGEGVVVGQHGEPAIGLADHRPTAQCRFLRTGGGPGEVDKTHAVDAAVVGDLRGHDDFDRVRAWGEVEGRPFGPADEAMVGLVDQVHLPTDVAGEVHFHGLATVEPVMLGHHHWVAP